MARISESSPLVSIVVPSYNHVNFIRDCIESIVNQTYKNYELIVIDDGSIDGTREKILELQASHGFKTVFQENVGLAETLTRGFREFSRGKYLTFCASDDKWTPVKLEKQVAFMENNPEYPMCYGKCIHISHDGEEQEQYTSEGNINLKGGHIFKELLNSEFHPPVNYLFRATIFLEVGYYDSTLWAEDFDMNLRIAQKHPIGYIPEHLSFYRRPPEKAKKLINFKTIESHLISINRFKDSPYYSDAIRQWHFRNYLWYCGYAKGKWKAIRGLILNPVQAYRVDKSWKYLLKLFFQWA